MNEGQIKSKILLLKAIDMSFFLAVFSLGLYSVLYSENGTMMGLLTLVGLFLVNALGKFSSVKIADLEFKLKKIAEEQHRNRK